MKAEQQIWRIVELLWRKKARVLDFHGKTVQLLLLPSRKKLVFPRQHYAYAVAVTRRMRERYQAESAAQLGIDVTALKELRRAENRGGYGKSRRALRRRRERYVDVEAA